MNLQSSLKPFVSKSLKYDPLTDKLLTVAAGCFWGTEHMFRTHLGNRIKDSIVGYSNGIKHANDSDPVTYEEVCRGDTNFAEVLQISYNPSTISLKELVDFFFRMHDPTTLNSQGSDNGTQYRSALFAHSESDLLALQELKNSWQSKWNNKIVTETSMINIFYDAEQYHQHYLENNTDGYHCPSHFLRDL